MVRKNEVDSKTKVWRVIKPSAIYGFISQYPRAEKGLLVWLKVTEKAMWNNIKEVQDAYPHADSVTVKSERTVVVFNVAGNNYRLIVAMHFDHKIAYVLRFLTHAEYSKNQWANQL